MTRMNQDAQLWSKETRKDVQYWRTHSHGTRDGPDHSTSYIVRPTSAASLVTEAFGCGIGSMEHTDVAVHLYHLYESAVNQ